MNPRATGSKVRRPSRPMHDRARYTSGRPMARPSSGRRRPKRKIGRKVLLGFALVMGLWYGYTDLWPVLRGWIGFAAELPPVVASTPQADAASGDSTASFAGESDSTERKRIRRGIDLVRPAPDRRESSTILEAESVDSTLAQAGIIDKAMSWVNARLAEMFKVRDMQLSGERTLPRDTLMQSLDSLRGAPLLPLDPSALADSLRAHPRVRDAVISKQLPGTVAVRIEERQEIALALVGGEFHGIDADHIVLPLPDGPWPLDLPVITGLDSLPAAGERIDHSGARTALRWVEEARRLPRVHAWLAEVAVADDSVRVILGQDGRTLTPGGHAVAVQTATLDALLAKEAGRPEGRLIDMTFPDYLIVRDEPIAATVDDITGG